MYSQGDKKGALSTLRECKVYENKLKSLTEEHPEIAKVAEEQIQPIEEVTPQPPIETPKPERDVEKVSKNAVVPVLQIEEQKEIEESKEQRASKKSVKKKEQPSGLSEIEIYENHHKGEDIESMGVIMHELDRLSKALKKEKNKEMKEQLKMLIEIIEFKRDSIQNDIDGGFMTSE